MDNRLSSRFEPAEAVQSEEKTIIFDVTTTKKVSPEPIHTVSMVTPIESRGPWKTKSDALLSVMFALPYQIVCDYFSYNSDELDTIPRDIRGLRAYKVTGIPAGNIGANEFHRVRKELLFAQKGEIEVVCEDLFGSVRTCIVTESCGISIPTYVIHTYHAKTDADLLVIANTLFFPDEPATHDTYPREAFQTLQQQFKGR